MKLLHVTSIASPHQLPLARCLAQRLGADSYRHVTTCPMDPERTAMGWGDAQDAPWMLRLGDRPELRSESDRWWKEADAVLCGERALPEIESRLRRGQLTFYMSERWWKPPIGIFRLCHPRFVRLALHIRRLAASPSFHYLAIGHFAHRDMRKLIGRGTICRLWGYFTELPPERPTRQTRVSGDGLEILYAGRLLEWKSLDVLLRAFASLRMTAPGAHLTLLGDGPASSALHDLARSLDVHDHITWLPSRPMAEVWGHMHRSHVFVLPSNGYEGWGAVVNEAMTYGCAAIASDRTGAASALIRDGENGLLFRSGDWRQLATQLGRLEADEALRRRLAEAGQETIYTTWSPDSAAERLITFCRQGELPPTSEPGPMTRLMWNHTESRLPARTHD